MILWSIHGSHLTRVTAAELVGAAAPPDPPPHRGRRGRRGRPRVLRPAARESGGPARAGEGAAA